MRDRWRRLNAFFLTPPMQAIMLLVWAAMLLARDAQWLSGMFIVAHMGNLLIAMTKGGD